MVKKMTIAIMISLVTLSVKSVGNLQEQKKYISEQEAALILMSFCNDTYKRKQSFDGCSSSEKTEYRVSLKIRHSNAGKCISSNRLKALKYGCFMCPQKFESPLDLNVHLEDIHFDTKGPKRVHKGLSQGAASSLVNTDQGEIIISSQRKRKKTDQVHYEIANLAYKNNGNILSEAEKKDLCKQLSARCVFSYGKNRKPLYKCNICNNAETSKRYHDLHLCRAHFDIKGWRATPNSNLYTNLCSFMKSYKSGSR